MTTCGYTYLIVRTDPVEDLNAYGKLIARDLDSGDYLLLTIPSTPPIALASCL